MYNFCFQEQLMSNVEGFLFQETQQLPPSWLEGFGSPGSDGEGVIGQNKGVGCYPIDSHHVVIPYLISPLDDNE
jgi:hypothetical protein